MLVQQELEAVVIRANAKGPPPQLGPPVAHSLDRTDELALVRRELVMTGGKRPAKEGQWPIALVKDGAKPHARGIAIHDEQLVEVRHLEDWPWRKGLLEGLERLGRFRVPREGTVA